MDTSPYTRRYECYICCKAVHVSARQVLEPRIGYFIMDDGPPKGWLHWNLGPQSFWLCDAHADAEVSVKSKGVRVEVTQLDKPPKSS